MSEALRILMKEELNEAEKKGISIGEARGRDEAEKEYKNQLAALMAENERLKALLG